MADILKFEPRQADRLRREPFTETWSKYNDVVELATSYGHEIIDTINEWRRGQVDEREISLVILRAQYACYERGRADAYLEMQRQRIKELNDKTEAERRHHDPSE